MTDDREHHYVATIPTREHLDAAYVAVGKKGGPSAWFITIDPSKAFNFGNGVEARKVVDILKGEHEEKDIVYMLGADPEKRLWHVTPHVPWPRT